MNALNALELDQLDGLTAAVVADILDGLGFRSQVMRPEIRPLDPTHRVLGFAATVEAVDRSSPPALEADYYRLHLAAIDALRPGEVMVTTEISSCFWGELLSIGAQSRGSVGIVIDGYTRDVSGVLSTHYPVFSRGAYPADALGRVEVLSYGGQITSGGVNVDHGDLIVGDVDGVVVIPQAVTDEVVSRGLEKLRGESTVRDALRAGMSVTEAFRTFGIL